MISYREYVENKKTDNLVLIYDEEKEFLAFTELVENILYDLKETTGLSYGAINAAKNDVFSIIPIESIPALYLYLNENKYNPIIMLKERGWNKETI